MKAKLLFPLVLVALLSGCGKTDTAESPEASTGATTPPPVEDPVKTVNGVTTVQMTGNDQMKFNVERFSVKTGDTVQIVFRNVGRMPKAAMGHNVVVLKAGVDADAFVAAAALARDNDYLPLDKAGEILASTALLGPNETDTIEFTAPEPGEYDFVCSFPAHLYAGMRGVMVVEPEE